MSESFAQWSSNQALINAGKYVSPMQYAEMVWNYKDAQLQSEKASHEGWQQQALEDEAALRRELAESQARERELRVALDVIALNRSPGKAWMFAEEIETMALQAVAMPYDDTALKALLAKERKRCRIACENEYVDAIGSGCEEDFAYNNAIDHCVNAISELGDEK